MLHTGNRRLIYMQLNLSVYNILRKNIKIISQYMSV